MIQSLDDESLEKDKVLARELTRQLNANPSRALGSRSSTRRSTAPKTPITQKRRNNNVVLPLTPQSISTASTSPLAPEDVSLSPLGSINSLGTVTTKLRSVLRRPPLSFTPKVCSI